MLIYDSGIIDESAGRQRTRARTVDGRDLCSGKLIMIYDDAVGFHGVKRSWIDNSWGDENEWQKLSKLNWIRIRISASLWNWWCMKQRRSTDVQRSKILRIRAKFVRWTFHEPLPQTFSFTKSQLGIVPEINAKSSLSAIMVESVHSSTFNPVHVIARTLLEYKQWTCSGFGAFAGLDEHIWQGSLSVAIMLHPKTTNLSPLISMSSGNLKKVKNGWAPTKAPQVIKKILSRIHSSRLGRFTMPLNFYEIKNM